MPPIANIFADNCAKHTLDLSISFKYVCHFKTLLDIRIRRIPTYLLLMSYAWCSGSGSDCGVVVAYITLFQSRQQTVTITIPNLQISLAPCQQSNSQTPDQTTSLPVSQPFIHSVIRLYESAYTGTAVEENNFHSIPSISYFYAFIYSYQLSLEAKP